jgi:hypothetical protein
MRVIACSAGTWCPASPAIASCTVNDAFFWCATAYTIAVVRRTPTAKPVIQGRWQPDIPIYYQLVIQIDVTLPAVLAQQASVITAGISSVGRGYTRMMEVC